MIIIGDKEIEENKISLRHKGEGDLGQISLDELYSKINVDLSN
jgi:threonyl-tRNA synthetase